MLSDLDWWIRIQFQKLLIWGGRKFGLTRRIVAVNGSLAYAAGAVGQGILLGWWFAAIDAVAVIIVFSITVYNLKLCEIIEGGEEINWETDKLWRRFILVFLLFNLFIDSILGTHVTTEKACYYLLTVGLISVLWATACKEAPPREKKESRKLAYSAANE